MEQTNKREGKHGFIECELKIENNSLPLYSYHAFFFLLSNSNDTIEAFSLYYIYSPFDYLADALAWSNECNSSVSIIKITNKQQ